MTLDGDLLSLSELLESELLDSELLEPVTSSTVSVVFGFGRTLVVVSDSSTGNVVCSPTSMLGLGVGEGGFTTGLQFPQKNRK